VGVVDLHVHTNASDGEQSPEVVVRCAVEAGVDAVAITDHDTVDGVAPAVEASAGKSVRVVAGCEFSVAVWWGELHLLGYFLPVDDLGLADFFQVQRERRANRAEETIERLARLGPAISMEAVVRQAGSAPIGRPHIARALVDCGRVGSVEEAFARYLADGGPACVPKVLPPLEMVVELVKRLGGVTSAAHLKERARRDTLSRLKELGVDGVEVLHPSHGEQTIVMLRRIAPELGMLTTGGSDWHGTATDRRSAIGSPGAPLEWMQALEQLHRERRDGLRVHT
jgi:predicted metal-dependent phosphoesterase TrpH